MWTRTVRHSGRSSVLMALACCDELVLEGIVMISAWTFVLVRCMICWLGSLCARPQLERRKSDHILNVPDRNECAEMYPSACPPNSFCENTLGSFKCIPKIVHCKEGTRRSLDGTKCENVDECLEGWRLPSDSRYLNFSR